ncbi:MAG: hypothetical protein IPO90_07920 [Flavobacteriales bacterium]|nr:hypothetical protein [Flavobacteriales bacterium]
MKQLLVSLTLGVITPCCSWAQDLPPDFYHDAQGKATAFWENPTPGYVIDTEGDLRPEVQYVSDGGAPRTFICRESRLSFQLASVDTTPGIPDTIHRLDMSFTGELFQAPNAIPFMVREPVRHFYLPQCGANGVTNVHAFERILYPEVYPGIDFWVYGGSSGQKMMIVIRPGADPNNLLLLFEGQTELTLDVFGNLKILLANQWIRIPQAVAYQYDQNNVITNVPWTAEYTPNENNGVVGFTFGAYNETKPLVLLIGRRPWGRCTTK